MNLFEIVVICMNIFFISLIIFNNRKKVNIPQQTNSPFDILISNGLNGMDIINNFLMCNALKYMNQKFINVSEKTDQIITFVINEISSDEKMSNFNKGFIVFCLSNMSKDLKNLFFRYYNNINNNQEYDEYNLIEYFSIWFMSFIRCMSLELDSRISGDFSIDHNKKINSEIFVKYELKLYEKLGLLEEKEKNNI